MIKSDFHFVADFSNKVPQCGASAGAGRLQSMRRRNDSSGACGAISLVLEYCNSNGGQKMAALAVIPLATSSAKNCTKMQLSGQRRP